MNTMQIKCYWYTLKLFKEKLLKLLRNKITYLKLLRDKMTYLMYLGIKNLFEIIKNIKKVRDL